MYPPSAEQYSPIAQGGAHESFEKLLAHPADLDVGGNSSCVGTHRPSAWRRSWPWLAAAAMLSVIAFTEIIQLIRPPSDAQCAARLSTYSPALEAVAYHTVDFNGSFRFPSEYRGTPSPAIDAAWEYISTKPGVLRIVPDELDKIGKPANPSLVRFRDDDGGGYMGSLEFTHQLHCLNALRKYTYREYYDGRDPLFDARPDTIRAHADHCIEMLRQTLMCHADTGLITYDWVAGYSTQYPDFSTRHVCRDFPRVLRWAYDHQVGSPEERVVRLADNVDLAEEP